MTEEEKIFAGKMFDPRKQELKDIKHKAHIACQKFNAMDEYDPQRSRVIGEILGKTGKVYYFQGPVQFNYGCHTFIGENFFANFNLTVMDDGPIYIGDNVCFGPNVSLMATNHPLIAQERMGLDEQGRTTMAEFAEEIRIGNNVWIACNATVIGGVTIGDNRRRKRGDQRYSSRLSGLRQSGPPSASHHRSRQQEAPDPARRYGTFYI